MVKIIIVYMVLTNEWGDPLIFVDTGKNSGGDCFGRKEKRQYR